MHVYLARVLRETHSRLLKCVREAPLCFNGSSNIMILVLAQRLAITARNCASVSLTLRRKYVLSFDFLNILNLSHRNHWRHYPIPQMLLKSRFLLFRDRNQMW
jgi:hypothetical protein